MPVGWPPMGRLPPERARGSLRWRGRRGRGGLLVAGGNQKHQDPEASRRVTDGESRNALGCHRVNSNTPASRRRTAQVSFRVQVMESWRVPQSCFILLLLACSCLDAQLDRSLYQEGGEGFGPIRPGIEVLLEDSLHLVEGRRVGLITNQTGVDASGRSSIDRIHEHPGVELVALFAPEHGIRAPRTRERRSRTASTSIREYRSIRCMERYAVRHRRCSTESTSSWWTTRISARATGLTFPR